MRSASHQNHTLRIDVHQHIISPVFRSLLKSVAIKGGAGEELALWDEESALALMDEYGIQSSILSYVMSGIEIRDPTFFRRLCRESNEYLAELVRKYPGKFGGFALVPLPDIDGALREIEYALDVLKLDGIGMHSNMGGVYPGDQRFDPVFNELNRHKTVVHLHPTDTPENHDLRPQWPPFIVEFIFETTRAAANLVYSGAMERYPNVSIILSHAGGSVPYQAWRFWRGEFKISDLRKTAPEGVYYYLKRFYYDIAMASNAVTLGALKEFSEPSRILFGTDLPYMSAGIRVFMEDYENYPGFDPKQRAAVDQGNALALFPRLKKHFQSDS